MSKGLLGNLAVTAMILGVLGWAATTAVREFTRRDWIRFAKLVGAGLVVAYVVLMGMFWHDLHRNTFDDPADAPLMALIVLPFVGLPLALAGGLLAAVLWNRVDRRRVPVLTNQ